MKLHANDRQNVTANRHVRNMNISGIFITACLYICPTEGIHTKTEHFILTHVPIFANQRFIIRSLIFQAYGNEIMLYLLHRISFHGMLPDFDLQNYVQMSICNQMFIELLV